MSERSHFDLESYVERTRNGPCFICKLIEGDPDFFHHVVYEDDNVIAFLNKHPTLYGYTLVAPKYEREWSHEPRKHQADRRDVACYVSTDRRENQLK
ncbi:MAG: HIT family protein [Rubrobacteraceae bacterium]